MMSKKEVVISPAIRYECQSSLRDEPTSVIIMGVDHDHAIESTIAGYAEPLGNIELGFMTSNKRFVTHSVAFVIALSAKQWGFIDCFNDGFINGFKV